MLANRQIKLAGAALTAASIVAAALYARHRRRASAVKRSWPHGVEVRASLILGGGDGLFASRDFAAGEALGEYYGIVLSLLQATLLGSRLSNGRVWDQCTCRRQVLAQFTWPLRQRSL